MQIIIYNILSTLITSPYFYIIVPLMIMLVVKREHKKTRIMFFILSLFFFLFFTNMPLMSFFQKEWYQEYNHPLPDGKVYTYGIVLGGYSDWDSNWKRPEFGENADRLIDGIQLYKEGRVKKLVLASDGSIIDCSNVTGLSGNPEGMIHFLNNMGVPSEDVILETKANSTMENAVLTLNLIGDSLKLQPSLLITSAIHMRRSIMAFNKVGIFSDTYITDTIIDRGDPATFIPSPAAIVQWQALLHEWVGYIYYKVMK